MIPSREIREKARGYGVPETTIERDYAQNWLLKYFSNLPMVLKGGTGIRKTYIENYRFSDDLDFTLLEDTNKETLKSYVKDAIIKTKEEIGINFDGNIEIEENENGFEISVYFRILRNIGNPYKIKLDLTKFGREQILLAIEKKDIIHLYSDDCFALIKVYSLEEIMAEKMRALFERIRPRDLYDVWCLWDKVDKNRVLNILPEKCNLKKVKLYIQSLINREDDFKNAWETSLNHQLKELPDFDEVFDKVVEMIK